MFYNNWKQNTLIFALMTIVNYKIMNILLFAHFNNLVLLWILIKLLFLDCIYHTRPRLVCDFRQLYLSSLTCIILQYSSFWIQCTDISGLNHHVCTISQDYSWNPINVAFISSEEVTKWKVYISFANIQLWLFQGIYFSVLYIPRSRPGRF